MRRFSTCWPGPFREWHWFAALVQAVLDAGAKPMITFAKFTRPFTCTRTGGRRHRAKAWISI